MANAKRCDRCKRFYLPYDGENLLIFGRALPPREPYEYGDNCYEEHRRYDLCEECSKDILFYVKNGGGPRE